MKILVLGASGLLGNAVFRTMSASGQFKTYGTYRHRAISNLDQIDPTQKLVECKDIEAQTQLLHLFETINPDVVINCISVPKPDLKVLDPVKILSIYSHLPRRLNKLAETYGSRLIHISSDGVFSGDRGNYDENDSLDAKDLYGMAKILGEVESRHSITIRTSIIGHELNTKYGLLEWFLDQNESCRCHSKAIFSGLPTVILARIIRDIIIPRPDLSGIYHVSSNPVSKFELLSLVAEIYRKSIRIIPDDSIVIDRSLNSAKFSEAYGYKVGSWPELIQEMYNDYCRAEIHRVRK